jgi:beta-glucosidase
MTTMTLPVDGSQDRLILAACEVNSNVIVVNSTGVAIEMPWLSRVSAVLQTWFPGQEAGNAIADVIFGKVNPSGRLPISIPRSLEDSPAYGNFPGDVKNLQVHYEEGIYIGYRYFDRNPEKVLFPFGFGLSYTEFAITDVKLLHGILSQTQAITVQARVRNIGSVSGHQIVQVYLAPLSTGGYRPQKSLAGFAKVALEPGESKTIEVAVSFEKAAFWDESSSLWTVEKGGYEILVGSSSMDIVGNGKFSVEETITFDP